MAIAFHHWWKSAICLFNFSMILNTCSHCLNPLSWMLCSNLLCGDSSLKASWWDSTSHSVFLRLLPSMPLSAIQSHLLSPTGLWYCLVVLLIGCGLLPSSGQHLGDIRILARAPVNAGWLCRSRKCKMWKWDSCNPLKMSAVITAHWFTHFKVLATARKCYS